MWNVELKNIRIGPSGNSSSFYNEGYTSTVQTPEWLSRRRLNAFEYSFGRGVRLTAATGVAIGAEMAKYDIAVSVHAPYYINFATADEDNAEKSYMYVKSSVKAMRHMGAARCVMHCGSAGRGDRKDALETVKRRLLQLAEILRAEGLYEGIELCPETMGKYSQIGGPAEILELCKVDPIYTPCYDFGHINCLTQGGLKTADDYKRLIDECADALGDAKTKNMHIHFSKIRYGAHGELNHLTFGDTAYGPEFEPLAEVIAAHAMTPVILCESDGTMAEDACAMKARLDAAFGCKNTNSGK
ncbi:MAG: TIM barrel protein [Firmicutes bacterium]|nr:TIM barrel protein [Bacillota bacterium]